MKTNLRAEYLIQDGIIKDRDIKSFYHGNIARSEKVRIDINRENDPLKMLDLSLLCIYFLTGDKSFYDINRQKLINFIADFDYEK